MNRNIDEYASAFQRDPGNATFSFEGDAGLGLLAGQARQCAGDWRELKDGIHEHCMAPRTGRPSPTSWQCGKTPTHAFFLAYDMTQTLQGQGQFNRMLVATVVVFTAFRWCSAGGRPRG
jgi:hypothetical protein